MNKNSIITIVVALLIGLAIGYGVNQFSGDDGKDAGSGSIQARNSQAGYQHKTSQNNREISQNQAEAQEAINRKNSVPQQKTIKKGNLVMENVSANPGRSFFPYFNEDKNEQLYINWIEVFDPELGIQIKKVVSGGLEDLSPKKGEGQIVKLGLMQFDSKNNLHLISRMSVNKKTNLYYSQNKNGKWSEPQAITTNMNNAAGPSFMIDKQDRLHLVWYDVDGHSAVIYYSQNKNGKWSPPVRVNAEKIGSTFWFPKATMDQKGQIHLVYQEIGSHRQGIYYQKRDTKGKWSEMVKVTGELANPRNPMALIDSKGKVHIFSSSGNYKDHDIYYTYQEKGKWVTPVNLTHSGEITRSYSAVVDGNDKIHLVWSDPKGKGANLYYINNASGDWSEALDLTDTEGMSESPFLFIDAKKKLRLIWHERASLTDSDIYQTILN
ncbi:MAG: BNR repeat-containing protein [Deltaproteobacteria bacterium]|nr:BNR repeat-containing protein [Deltaproteobacteria bacterium]